MLLGDPHAKKYEDGPVELPIGRVIKSRWKIIKKLGAGGCGAVYSACDLNNGTSKVALKAESNFVQGGSVLKLEVEILKRMKENKHTGRLIGCGKTDRYQYMVMTLLGDSLALLLRKCKRTSTSTQLKLGIHVLHGVKGLHDIGFVHRDMKPANLAMGRNGQSAHIVHLLDFGLSREYIVKEDVVKMRRPRERALFRGTTQYCSVATHDRIEQGRVDDLWSLLYILAECKNELPWASSSAKQVAEKKRNMADATLLKDSPIQLCEFAAHLRTLNYYSRPDYVLLYTLLVTAMEEGQYKMTDPWDWEKRKLNNNKSLEEETAQSVDNEVEDLFNKGDFEKNPFNF